MPDRAVFRALPGATPALALAALLAAGPVAATDLAGQVDSSHVDRLGVNAVYVFQGHGVPDDLDGSGDPLLVVPVEQVPGQCGWRYAASGLAAGDYTLAFTAEAGTDDPGRDDPIGFGPTLTVTLGGAAQQVDFPAARILRVGPGRSYALPSEAAAVAQPGDVIEIDAGVYDHDIVVWRDDDLTLRGVGGRAHIRGTQPIPYTPGVDTENGMGLWVMKANGVTVENIEFSGAVVPPEHGANGAGIRAQGSDLTVCNSYFHDNENGILGGAYGTMLIEYTEFEHNGLGDYGRTHNIYVVGGERLIFRHNYSHRAHIGHNLKTRARENHILYNRLMDEADGDSSYAVDVPNGGLTYLIGNVIQQSPYTDNSTMVIFGAEGLSGDGRLHNFYAVNNTLVNDRGSGTFVAIAGGTGEAKVVNNLFVGSGTPVSGAALQGGNLQTSSPALQDRAGFDYRLTAASPAIDAGVAPGTGAGVDLTPRFHYVYRTSREPRPLVGAIDVGAYEHGAGTGNQGPAAAFTASPTSGQAPLAVSFDASASSDPDGSIAAYAWRFGDGATASGVTAAHTYQTAGNYTATLTVTDDAGASASTSRTVSVSVPPPPNQAPTATFTLSPPSGIVPLAVTLDASASFDPDGSIVEYAWDLGGGVALSGASTGHVFTDPGVYPVTLTVTDDDGAQALLTQTVTASPPPNLAPVARIAADPVSGEAPLVVRFDGSGSSDPDGSVVGHAWRFGDGAQGSGASVQHSYATAGVYTATLTVTDDDGATALRSVRITVNEPPPPPAEDSDGDGLPDAWEIEHFGDLSRDGSGDLDGDGAADAVEFDLGLDPAVPDSDGDGAPDGEELTYGSNPGDALDNWQSHRPAQPQIAPVADPAPVAGQVFHPVGSYADPDGDAFAGAEWQVSAAADFAEPVLSRLNPRGSAVTIPAGVLAPSSPYWVRTRHRDANGMPSEWSAAMAFRTGPALAYDADGDGTDDRFQVSGFRDADGNGVSDELEGMCNLRDAVTGGVVGIATSAGRVRCLRSLTREELPAAARPSGALPYGLFGFVVEDLPVDPARPASVEIRLHLPAAAGAVSRWWQYDTALGRGAQASSTVIFTGEEVVLRLTDGGSGDLDGVVNGRIVDPSGPLSATAETVPVVVEVDTGGAGGLGPLGIAVLALLAWGRRRPAG